MGKSVHRPQIQDQPDLLQAFDYALIRSRRRTLSIQVREGRVTVRAPLKAPLHWIESFVTEKAGWVRKQLHLQSQQQSERPVIESGGLIHYLGEPRHLAIVPGPGRGARLTEEQLQLHTDDPSGTNLQTLLFSWLRDSAREYMIPRTRDFAARLQVAQRLGDVVFRKTRSKWGHCRPDGTIQYNPLVMQAPVPVVDYLIIHETAHLLHLDHSARFWKTVESLCPDYRDLRAWLHHNGHRLWPHAP